MNKLVVLSLSLLMFAGIAGAVTINIGTLSPYWLEGMRRAAVTARESETPWVLDPVAHFATAFRRDAAAELLDLRPDIVRGNASEILALAGAQSQGRGVDSQDPVDAAREAAEKRETELRDAAEQLVATTFIMPLFSQLRNDPMASEMFHGGRGEKVFQQQLDQVLSDRISTGAGFELVDTVADYFAGRRGGAEQARSALNSAVAPVVDRMPEVDIHG